MTSDAAGLFPALLKHWRRSRGLSQLDLAIASDVSARHISFLETGRSNPSPEMVIQLGMTLGMPLRQINSMLRSAHHSAAFDEDDVLPDTVQRALDAMLRHHEPFPVMVIDRYYRLRDLNEGALSVLAFALGIERTPELSAQEVVEMGMDVARLTFDPAGARPAVANFDEVGRELLWRIHREVLTDPEDGELRQLFDDLLASDSTDPEWRTPDLSASSEPALPIHLRREAVDLRFITMMTAFQAPQNVAVADLRIETWLPADDATAARCQEFAAATR